MNNQALSNLCNARPALSEAILRAHRNLTLIGASLVEALTGAGYVVEIGASFTDPSTTRFVYVGVPDLCNMPCRSNMVRITYTMLTNLYTVSCSYHMGKRRIRYVNEMDGLLEELPFAMAWLYREVQCRTCHYGNGFSTMVFCGKGLRNSTDELGECSHYKNHNQ